MNILALSDLHGRLPTQLPAVDYDLCIIAGDICPDYNGSGHTSPYWHRTVAEQQARWLQDRFEPWCLTQLYNLGIPVVMIWGNHDYVGEFPDLVAALPVTARVLQDAGTVVKGLRIWGSPWTHFAPADHLREKPWAFDKNETELVELYQHLPASGEVDVLVTHGPAWGVLDGAYGLELGSPALGIAVGRLQPRLHIFGHIHEGRGQRGTSYNVSMLDGRYQPYPQPLTVITL